MSLSHKIARLMSSNRTNPIDYIHNQITFPKILPLNITSLAFKILTFKHERGINLSSKNKSESSRMGEINKKEPSKAYHQTMLPVK